jgi:23S rRNA (uracil1939-C5)-methyltransferase
MSISSNIVVELTSHAFGGDAFGRLPDGRAVFVPFALPGEVVSVRLVEEKRGYARAELVEVHESAAERTQPRCKHFGVCGGCHYQHLSHPGQLIAKREILRQQLQRIGAIPDPPVGQTVPSPQAWEYRNHVQFHQTPSGALGYNKARSDTVFPIEECLLPEAAIGAVWPQLDFELIPGLERIGMRQGAGEDLQLILESSTPDIPEISIEGLPLSVIHMSPEGLLVLVGSQAVEFDVLERTFRVSAGAFFQANSGIAGAMVAHLLETLPLHPGTTLLELYCGVGLFSAFLAGWVGRLVGVEASPFACADFEANLDEYENVELYEAQVEQVIATLNLRPDIVLVDPPRSGLGQEVAEGVASLQPECIAYVSCDPATLARDARTFTAAGYQLVDVTPFDAFPQTYHIESISRWVK